MSNISDIVSVARGLRKVIEAGIILQESQIKLICKNSSLKPKISTLSVPSVKEVSKNVSESLDKLAVVVQGYKQYTTLQLPNMEPTQQSNSENIEEIVKDEIDELNRQFNKTFSNLENFKSNSYGQTTSSYDIPPFPQIDPEEAAKLIPKQRPLITIDSPDPSVPMPTTKKKAKQCLSANSKARVVPSTRIGRMISFGTLAAGLGVGTVAQYTRNTVNSLTGKKPEDELAFLSPANAERIVETLCKVRGAALKLGQLLSLQDESVISPELQRIFERVRQSADFMPKWQVEKVLVSQLGIEWRKKLKYFEEKPFAAASIGQVHYGVLHDGTEIAMKIQYPGVAKGINSDIDNLYSVLNVWNIFPKGMFIENVMDVAKKELAWEVDYVREAECTKLFKKLLEPYPEYYVPSIINELCSAEVLTSELIEGVPLDKCFEMDPKTKHYICYKIMQLCLREMFEFRCMQTDPNWANFFYNAANGKIVLLDFGATRHYSKEFMDQYIEIIKAASIGDRDAVLRKSKEMKFLTGYETKVMEETHVDTVMIMGEVFTVENEEGFDFGTQQTTKRIQSLVPTILTHRLCPPPEEIYSLHRKLSGVFLMCSKMKVKLNCRDMFNEIYEKYKTLP